MTTKTKRAVRQGDVLVVPVADLPRLAPRGDRKKVETHTEQVILAHGEVTGHHHSMYRGAVMFRDDGGSGGTFIDVAPTAEPLVHQEHSALKIAPGVNRVLRQRVAVSGVVRRVAD